LARIPDNDGICDAVDDCPDVFDPGQPDLDGDGIALTPGHDA
jgi:hypothetical protein